MAFDQALKQNNKTIKATNGDINAVNQENKTKFLRMIKNGKPYKSKRPNKDYTPISKSDDDHYVADRTVVDLSVLIRSLASFAVSK